jgi:hypothetical protein
MQKHARTKANLTKVIKGFIVLELGRRCSLNYRGKKFIIVKERKIPDLTS